MPEDIETLKARIASLEQHLGSVLVMLSDLHPDHRCKALDEAQAFYNECKHECKVETGQGYQKLIECADYNRLVHEIASLEQKLEEMKSRLEPFARIPPSMISETAEIAHYWVVNGSPEKSHFTREDLARAREVLGVMPLSESAEQFVSAEGPLQSNDGVTR